jgi:stearoyl-CoA desaturase (delta-9 desaturase)
VRQGFKAWEIDPTFYVLKALSWLRIVWDLKTPPPSVLRNEHKLGSRVIERAAAQLAATFNSERIALAIASAVEKPDLAALQERLAQARQSAVQVLTDLGLPHLPSREEILARATAMFAKTPSIEAVVDRAYGLLVEAIGHRLRMTVSNAAA